MTNTDAKFLGGVVEGFYGKPWSRAERLELFGWMRDWGLKTYLYAPKDDLHHRAIWRQRYEPEQAEELRKLTAACREHGIRFIYALGPGLDLSYSSPTDLDQIKSRCDE